MSRFYVPKEKVGEKEIAVSGNEAHHIMDVMRLRRDDKVTVFDGTGCEYTGYIRNADQRSGSVKISITERSKAMKEDIPEITLAQAIPKKNRMDYIVEKATELGAARIVPLVTERTIVRPDNSRSGKKTGRWRKIAIESSKQCGRSDVPGIDGVTRYDKMAGSIKGYDLALLACLESDTVPIKKALAGFTSGSILVFVGPEGDFTPEEIALAKKGNCRLVSLGGRVLKSDTAGLFILSALNYEFSRYGAKNIRD